MQQKQSNSDLSNSNITYKKDGLHYTGTKLFFRITGLKSHNLDRLKITLKASSIEKPDIFHIDSLDLYNSRSRESYCESCNKYLKVKVSITAGELTDLIKVLEKERINMKESGNKTAPVEMTPEEKKEALEALRSKNLLKNIVTDFESIGFIGEKHNKLLGYIASISRLIPDPLALLILSRSGAERHPCRKLFVSLSHLKALSSILA